VGAGYRLAVAAAVAITCVAVAVAVTAMAAVDPSPGRHARGLLVVVAFVLAGGVLSAWIRVARALRTPTGVPGAAVPGTAVGPPGPVAGGVE
jgi:hypothetical protein